ncbi:YggS family pyridoxal phosphate-dependent enzyme [Myxococcus sp. MxC21-1]|uniref:YggS family pyridoxal phosphate-dependent enzyme n=1 Tax=Myxococcus sp. MxC21-1 TaxID=3041439 RepID=UPI00292F1694|nr:YggS family pyridoxal phosphate-dependent enzyme [Myxococcus sp. MxC21-1]WNZ64680.1 YggS family pyridoxal phosphate-dependent enzyme [Myxococcus sp. MxC21-1]
MSGSVAERLASVRERVAAACARAGRPVESVTLVAVSKLKPADLIREAYAAGQRDFGENYAQELRDKAAELEDLEGLRWHAIGALQTNKVKYVARAAGAFHALDRLEVARELSKRREGAPPLPVYVEVNVGGESTKSGRRPTRSASSWMRSAPCRPPGGGADGAAAPTEEEARARADFQALRELARVHGLPGLSMGTTHDFEWAIEEGATVVRVGTAIFGERALKSP